MYLPLWRSERGYNLIEPSGARVEIARAVPFGDKVRRYGVACEGFRTVAPGRRSRSSVVGKVTAWVVEEAGIRVEGLKGGKHKEDTGAELEFGGTDGGKGADVREV